MGMPAPDVVGAEPAEAKQLAQVLRFIEAHEAGNGTIAPRSFFLSAADEGERVELTEQLHALLKQVVHGLSGGQSISILTRDQEISTQQAAQILGLSRPTVLRLIDTGELPAHVPGAVRRKLHLADVLAYREELHAQRNRFITESSAAYDDAEPDELADLLAKARTTR